MPLGGGVVSLTAVAEGLVERAIMVETDREVAAFWHAAVDHGEELARWSFGSSSPERASCGWPTPAPRTWSSGDAEPSC
jgi:hypothetical protein